MEVATIARPSADPHRVEVLPSYMVRVSRAALYLKVGFGLDRWADRIIDGSHNSDLEIVDCSRGIVALEVPHDRVEASMGDIHPSGNTHYWLDPQNGATLWRAEFPVEDPEVPNPWTGGNGFNPFIDSKADFAADGTAAYLHTAIAPGGVVTDRAFLNAVDLDPGLPPPSELLRSTDIWIKGYSRGAGVIIRSQITVQDESLTPVPQAIVHVTWTLPDGTDVIRIARTNNSGKARFRVSGEGGFYTITVTDITKNGYTFDPDNSVLSKTIAWF